MKWLFGALALLIFGLVFKLGLLVYAMYALLTVLLVSRYLAWVWTANLTATRACDKTKVRIADSAHVTVTVLNSGSLKVPWLLLEDSLPLDSLREQPQRLQVLGKTLFLTQMPAGAEKSFAYEVRFLARGYYQLGPLLLERDRKSVV